MSLGRRAAYVGKSAALWVCMALVLLGTGLGGLGLLAAALLIWLAHYVGMAGASAICGVLLLVVGALCALIFTAVLRRMRARQPSLVTEAVSTLSLALRFGTFIVRRDPRKAVLTALITGAVAEYFLGERRNKS
ncbi:MULTISPECIES: hypothetical protein [unclassified Acidocella]|uniref:hypothetical protein n=1 Tax=unclassified Acidocella TaxID=2648610 RepID=UPI00028D2FCD|nr:MULTISPECIES: hypothetical protein [unclassified Acidocella]EKM99629.1 hypothetical protein MXAZACID_09586 [Acidocella sp. MX-AZ02]WBO58231.1 hypothetical protein GT370_13510 [Acidocella sp. MX-AZ03]